mgnify:CR=1 FL=1
MSKAINRCKWAEGVSPDYIEYHDREWGVPVFDDRVQFEFLILEGAQAGLSWSTILNKREGYRKAFADFDPEKVAAFLDGEAAGAGPPRRTVNQVSRETGGLSLATSSRLASPVGIKRMASTARVQNQADENIVQPSTNNSVKAAGTRLRRRLSNSFQRDSAESGLFRRRPSGPGTRGSSQPAICQSPRIQR